MKISNKTEYGLRALAYVAKAGGSGRIIGIKEIAANESMPPEFLEKIASTLEKAGFLVSKRGVKGGYTLARPAGKIKLGAVIRALEGKTGMVKCVGGRGGPCPMRSRCRTKDFWRKFQKSIDRVLDSVTLKDLLKSR